MNKNRAILIAILVCLVAVFIVLHQRGPRERQYSIFDLDTLSVAQIEIYDQADTLKLQKLKGTWMLVEPVKWEADTLKIQSLFRDVLSAKYPKTPMGTGPEAIKRFALDDQQALHIKISDAKGKRQTHVMFGNMGNPFDYFRYENGKDVYQIKTKVVTVYTTQLPMWRSPDVINFTEEQMVRMDISHANNSYSLTKKGFDWFFEDKTQNFKISPSNRSLQKIMNILYSLQTYVFVDDTNPEQVAKFQNPECTVQIFLKDGSKQELKFSKIEDNQYLMMVNGDPSVLFAVTPDTVFRFMRSPEVFKKDFL